jgi:hypothetical protein
MEALNIMSQMTQRQGLGDVQGMTMAIQALQGFVQSEALIMGFRDSFLVLAGVFVLAIVPVGFLRSKRYLLARPADASNAEHDIAAIKPA